MIELWFTRLSDSKGTSPLHMVKKTTHGNWRPSCDYRGMTTILCRTCTTVSRRLDERELVLSSEKCHVGRTEVGFLCHLVNYLGVRPLDAKVTPVADNPESRTNRQFWQLFGLLNVCRRLIASLFTLSYLQRKRSGLTQHVDIRIDRDDTALKT